MRLFLTHRSVKVRKSATKSEIRVKVNIKPVKLAEVTPAQRQLVKKFWSRLIAEVKGEER